MSNDFRDNDHEETTLWLGAARYYLGRRTYAVTDFCRLLVQEWDSLNPLLKGLIERDIEDEFKRDDEHRRHYSENLPLGDNCDREAWVTVRSLWQDKRTD